MITHHTLQALFCQTYIQKWMTVLMEDIRDVDEIKTKIGPIQCNNLPTFRSLHVTFFFRQNVNLNDFSYQKYDLQISTCFKIL